MYKTKEINVTKILYVACFLTPDSVKTVQMLYGETINDMHMTLTFYGKKECDFPINLIGTKVTLTVDSWGEYKEEDVVKNIGLHISDDTMKQRLPDGSHLAEHFAGSVPHITMKVENGGKPVTTAKCAWHSIIPFRLEAEIGVVERR